MSQLTGQNEWSSSSSWGYSYNYSGSSQWGGQYGYSRNWGYRGWYGSYNTNYGYQSKYDYDYEYANQGHYKSNYSSRSTDISGGEAYGALNSIIDLGEGDNNASVNVVAGNRATGLGAQASRAAVEMTAST